MTVGALMMLEWSAGNWVWTQVNKVVMIVHLLSNSIQIQFKYIILLTLERVWGHFFSAMLLVVAAQV